MHYRGAPKKNAHQGAPKKRTPRRTRTPTGLHSAPTAHVRSSSRIHDLPLRQAAPVLQPPSPPLTVGPIILFPVLEVLADRRRPWQGPRSSAGTPDSTYHHQRALFASNGILSCRLLTATIGESRPLRSNHPTPGELRRRYPLGRRWDQKCIGIGSYSLVFRAARSIPCIDGSSPA